ncbi:hypothetical protein L915_20022 [Phytophthora nicotianae]|uniref:Uncharacterized protein n=1 Tax=Phytophthora nicotianae TaxID=4792 RepID=W2HZ43_PHYNI|nr:hypothetical protein L915_20022 [Phytophthora nicotianae]ETL26433.1 hypothetical protein L916_19898 [Phytophthora nicotianae]
MVDSAEMNNVNLIKVKEGGVDRGGWSWMCWTETTERANKESDHSEKTVGVKEVKFALAFHR